MVGDTRSKEDPNEPGRKGQWMTAMGGYIKSYMLGLDADIYSDSNYTNEGMQRDTSPASLAGYKTFASDAHFKISTWAAETKRRAGRQAATGT
jgi:hypothetical protein